MTSNKKRLIYDLLKGIETGDEKSVQVVNEAKYIQHNPQTHEGSLGLAALFKELAKSSPRVNIVRIFEDGNFVFGHTEYDFANSNIGFEVFRFEDGQAVEHWDNIQRRIEPNLSGHTMVDGTTGITDLDRTEEHRGIVSSYVKTVLIEGQHDRLEDFVDSNTYVEHRPLAADGIEFLRAALSDQPGADSVRRYAHNHRILAEGNFVLAVNEGYIDDAHASFYDLFRLSNGKIVEHWDTTEIIPPESQWKNDNGKF